MEGRFRQHVDRACYVDGSTAASDPHEFRLCVRIVRPIFQVFVYVDENAALNGFDNVEFVAANAFDYLKEQCAAGNQFDVVILDPPAFTKSRANIDAATRGYKEINLRGMQLVKNGGYLITCSCSQHILPDMFMNIVKSAAQDARVSLFQVEYRTQGKDHPILPNAVETQYLKCGIFRIDK